MPAPGEADYRYYNCNLQAPKIKCKQLTMDSFTVSQWYPSGICTYNGYRAASTTHTFTTTDIMCLSNSNMSGEFTMYVRHGAGYSAVVLLVITKAKGSFTYNDFYQALGNLSGVVVSSPSTSSFTVTFAEALEARWIFRGF
jgi:regulation of enolase protein 1 (concanavalin A-like superfamily)